MHLSDLEGLYDLYVRIFTRINKAYSNVSKHPQHLPTVIRTLIANGKTSSNPLSSVPLVGTAIDVKLRFKHVKDTTSTSLDTDLKVSLSTVTSVNANVKIFRNQAEILSFYGNTVLMSRSPVRSHITVCNNIPPSSAQSFTTEYRPRCTTSSIPQSLKRISRRPFYLSWRRLYSDRRRYR